MAGLQHSSLESLLEVAASAAVVMIGDASHGTQQHYEGRCSLTKALIECGSCAAVVIEGSAACASQINEYVLGLSADVSAKTSLRTESFPKWKWCNSPVSNFVEWLKYYNLDRERKVLVWGMEPKDARRSCERVLAFLQKHAPPSCLAVAAHCYSTLMEYEDPVRYAKACVFGDLSERAEELQQQLKKVERLVCEDFSGIAAPWEAADARLNAAAVGAAEEFYYILVDKYSGNGGKLLAWEFRTEAMLSAIQEVQLHCCGALVVWSHNSHLGGPGLGDGITLGGALSSKLADKLCRVGYETFEGTVRAAAQVGGESKVFQLGCAPPRSLGRLLHQVYEQHPSGDALYMRLVHDPQDQAQRHLVPYGPDLIQRSIGTVYDPQNESERHWVPCKLDSTFDFVVHTDQTFALKL